MSQSKTLPQNEKIHYNRINYSLRVKLIEKVEKQGSTIKAAAIELGIKQSTAKFIVASYRKKGRIFKRKLQKIDCQFEEVKQQKKYSQNYEPINDFGIGYYMPISYVFYYPYY